MVTRFCTRSFSRGFYMSNGMYVLWHITAMVRKGSSNIFMMIKIYRITAILKVETDIITCITVRLTGWAVILVIMYIKTFKTKVTVFISNIIMCLTSHWQIIFKIRISSLIQTISPGEIKGKMSKLSII